MESSECGYFGEHYPVDTLFKIEHVANKFSWRIALTPVGGLNFA